MTQLHSHHHDVAAIKALIQTFFDAINAADTVALGQLFFSHANLTILRQDPPRPPSATYYPAYTRVPLPARGGERDATREGDGGENLTVVIRTSIEKFIALLEAGKKRREGRPGPVLHEEPDLGGTDVKVDELFGMAWSPFQVTFDGVLHHYGTLVYTLGKVEAEDGEKEWRIEGLTQNYRRTPGWEGAYDFM